MEESSTQITILINGILLDDRNSNVYNFTIEESIAAEFPKLELFVSLRAEFLNEFAITDGSPIEIKIFRAGSDYGLENWNFRVYSYDAMSTGDGGSFQYKILAYHESLWLLSCIEDECYTCNSTEVFERIATKVKMPFSTDETRDRQTWFTLEGNRLEFMRDVCAHAFADKYSVFAWWVGKEGKLFFHNLVSRIQEKPKCTIRETTDITKDVGTGKVPVMQVTYSMESGINNFAYGYGNNISFFDSFNTKNRTIYPRDFKTNVQSVNVLKTSQNQGWLDLGIDSGNTHSNYKRAFIQNKRGLALWSTVITCIDLNDYPFKVGDCINFELKVDGFNDVLLHTGHYIVAGLIYTIDQTNKPKTKLFLVRQGVSSPTMDISR